ncbi:MAG: Histidine kinase-, DNA gyrase B-, and [Parcubacteria group bacterium GW2011_GWB1_36_5]|nr:MAG: Histidine kinase-, DNA gyrase B-, and [Parcubacteria group bacterium GW2011_GWB1_36_5]
MIEEILNTCLIALEANPNIKIIVGYSHIIPVVLSLILGIFVFIKTKFSLFSKIFIAFIIVFSLWLIGDVIVWTSNDYHLVYATWSFLDYLEIVFYALGLYFALVFVKKSDISILWKIALFALTLPALWLTISLRSVTGFNQSVCEAFNNDFLGQYKLAIEGIILIIILLYTITPFFNKLPWQKTKSNLIVLGSMFLFLSIFGITEYLASVTGYYEMNLYSLFLLPVFLIAIIYSVFELDIFKVRILGTHYLVVGLVILIGGQLLFVTNSTNRLLTILTIALLVALSVILFRNLKRESDQRVYIEKLNMELKNLIKQRENLVHLVTHKVKGSFTRTKYLFAGMLDGTFGEISPEIREKATQGLEFDNGGIQTVDLVLEASNLSSGIIKYEMKTIDLKEVVQKTTEEKRIPAEKKGLKIEMEIKNEKDAKYEILGDYNWLKEAINNLIENSIRYTPKGKIAVELEKKSATLSSDGKEKILFSVKDTGIGITEEDKKSLFTEGGRGKDSIKVNVDSTGYGLFSVKLIIEAHQGKVWAESEGVDKGSTFFVELDAIKDGP